MTKRVKMSYRIRGWQKTSEVFHDMERATDKILEADLELKKEFGDLPRRSKIASYCKGERKASTVQTILDKFFLRTLPRQAKRLSQATHESGQGMPSSRPILLRLLHRRRDHRRSPAHLCQHAFLAQSPIPPFHRPRPKHGPEVGPPTGSAHPSILC